ncbi:alpha/beta-hydrolase [Penicillium frequentans]|nr:alpha/beta-hydrolase [Penicillium glabrum]
MAPSTRWLVMALYAQLGLAVPGGSSTGSSEVTCTDTEVSTNLLATGNTKDESGASYGLNTTLETYYSDVNETYEGVCVHRFLDLYPANDSISASGAESSQYTDRSKIGTWLWSQMWNEHYDSPVYNYFWDHAPPGQDQGAYHESEINYVLNNLYATDKPWTAEDYAIAKNMNAYWANFIKTGNPNGKGLVSWPAVNSSELVQHVGDG